MRSPAARRRRQTSRPSMPGIMTSSTIASGGRVGHAPSAASPSSASVDAIAVEQQRTAQRGAQGGLVVDHQDVHRPSVQHEAERLPERRSQAIRRLAFRVTSVPAGGMWARVGAIARPVHHHPEESTVMRRFPAPARPGGVCALARGLRRDEDDGTGAAVASVAGRVDGVSDPAATAAEHAGRRRGRRPQGAPGGDARVRALHARERRRHGGPEARRGPGPAA